MNFSRAFWIAAAYSAAAYVWVLLSDGMLFALLPGQVSVAAVSTGKGVAFVLVTSIGLYCLLVRLSHLTDRDKLIPQMQRAELVFNNAAEGIIVTDARSKILDVNPSFERLTGYTREEVQGRNPRILHSGRQDAALYREMWASLNATGQWRGEIWNRRKNGEIYPEWLTISAVRNADGVVTHYIGMFSDLTAQKKTQKELDLLAYYDPLTELPNRRLMHERIERAITRAQRTGEHLAVMYLDVDRFKIVNAGMGYTVGDEVLREMAQRMAAQVRQEDTIARVGGDEFAVLLECERSPRDVATIARRFLQVFADPVMVDGQPISVTTSIGVSLYPGDGQCADDMLGHADRAMTEVKSGGRNAVRFFSPELTDGLGERVRLETALRAAVGNEELRLHYQPQLDLQTRELTGVEVLVRWQHPQRGMVSPAEFIPLAEEIGVIEQIGDWVLEQACAQLARWRADGVQVPCVAVNLSARQLLSLRLVEHVADEIRRHGLAAGELELELTETMLMERAETCKAAMNELRALGVKLAIDDFGTGYSSLAYLKTLPVERLKIDRSFVKDIGRDTGDEAIVRAVIAMARSLGLDTVGEGVETEAQARFLAKEGCTIGQGYHFSRPLPASAFQAWLEAR